LRAAPASRTENGRHPPPRAGSPAAIEVLLSFLIAGLLSGRVQAQGIVTTPIGSGDDEAVALAIQPDGKIVVAGFSHNGSDYDFAVVRYNSDSSLDTSFSGDGKLTTPIGGAEDRANAVAIQPDGKIVVAGFFWNGTSNAFAVVRYNTDGSLDTSFDVDGIATTDLGSGDDQGRGVAIQSDGKIVVSGYTHNGTNYDFAVVRYNVNGSLDTSFDTDGIVTTPLSGGDDRGEAVALQSDGKILVAGDVLGGAARNFGVVRYNTTGTLDASFDTDGIVITDFLANEDNARSIAVQPDGRILVGGSSHNGSNLDFSLARYNTNGSLDVSFDTDGKVTTNIAGGLDLGFGLDVQPDGKIVQAGWGQNGANLDFAVVRYNPNGSLDTSFDLDGKVTTPVGSGNDFGYRMAVEFDGKIVVAGSSHNGSNLDVGLVRYCPNGSTQGTFSGTFEYRKAITIDETRVMGSSDLIDFPVLINVTDPQLATTAFGGQVRKGDGSDIIFTASCGGPRLAHEIEKYVDSTGELIAWVKVPLVRYNVNTVLFMYYGNPNVGCSTQNPSGVWDTSFKGVWHLKETPAGAPGEIRDSTANDNAGTGAGNFPSLPDQFPGRIDGSLVFYGSNERHVLVPDSPSLRLPTAVTLSAWVQTGDVIVDNRVIALKWDGDPTKRNYWLGKIGTNLDFHVDDTQFVTAAWGLVNDGLFHHVVGVADPAALLLRLYVDGIERNTAAYTGTSRTSTGDFRIGNSTQVFQVFDGLIDEVQVSGTVRSPGWIDTSFRNQNSPATFYSVGLQQTCPCSLRVNFRSIGTNAGVLYNVGNASIDVGTTTVNFGGGASLPTNVGTGDQLVIGAETFYVLSRNSSTQVTVQSAATSTHSAEAYTITRAYNDLATWETARQGNLAADDRREVGVAYRDASAFAAGTSINGSTTDSCHFMWLTAAPGQRHTGVAGTGAILDGNNTDQGIRVADDYTIVEWLELTRNRGSAGAAGVVVNLANNVLLQNLLIYDFADAVNLVSGIRAQNEAGYTVRNSIIYNGGRAGIRNNDVTAVGLVENCTAYNMRDPNTGVGFLQTAGSLTVTNSIAAFNDADFSGVITQAYNLSSDGTASGTAALPGRTATDLAAPGPGNWVVFSNLTPGGENLHLQASLENDAVDSATDLSSKFWNDIDSQSRLGLPWDRGADELGEPTAVTLSSFSAWGGDGEVWLEWTTASELNNLGFHLYRAASETGSYERITARPIPGLGSSPVGARYSYLDSGLSNGSTYYYKLEDIETTGRTKLHGPVSATPQAAAGGGSPDRPEGKPDASRLVTFGDPSANRLSIVSWSEHGAVVELVTEGFYGEVLEDGTVRLSIPDFYLTSEAGFPSVPVTRPWINAVGGRDVRLVSVGESGVERFDSLRPTGVETPEIEASPQGTVRASSRRARMRAGPAAKVFPENAARLLGTGFQGQVKKVQLELAPLRWDGGRRELLLARRLVVRLAFRGRLPEEGPSGLRPRRRASHQNQDVLARLATREKGLYTLAYEDVFPRPSRRTLSTSALRLSRLGEPVAFHVEPDPSRFQPGSRLYFLSLGAQANPYGNEAVYELARGEGTPMPLLPATPSGEAMPYYWRRADHEVNRYYQAGLLEAPDLWFWDALLAPLTKSYPFEVRGLAPSVESARLSVWLQGGSDFAASTDHHVRIAVNRTSVAELYWDGKTPKKIEVEVPPGVLTEGENRLEIENVGDTEAQYSLIFLDRFTVEYPRIAEAEGERLEGGWSVSGTAAVTGLSPASYVVDVTEEGRPAWLTALETSPDGTVRFRAEAGRRYALATSASVLRPAPRKPLRSQLKDTRIGADYLVLGPPEFLDEAQALVDFRRSQGLRARAVSLEQVYDEFGFGEARPEALREFLEYAYHNWRKPQLRYVLLLGDGTYDYKDYLGTGVVNRVPPLMVKTSYLWTASDPTLAAINGEDFLPDIAIGRLPAATKEELRAMLEKILAYETGKAGVSVTTAVLVADNPDEAGDFVAEAEEIAGGALAGRPVEKLYLSRLGPAAMRAGIAAAFDSGASLMSYIGHGGIHLWAQENIFNSGDVPGLAPQPQQPLLLTMNCLNGYFHFPYFNSLSEELLKAEDKGAIAAFSPSGLSLDAPAHRFHQALLEAVLHHGHARLGDAVLAGQAEYAASGAFPELLRIYHLLGDPALTLR